MGFAAVSSGCERNFLIKKGKIVEVIFTRKTK